MLTIAALLEDDFHHLVPTQSTKQKITIMFQRSFAYLLLWWCRLKQLTLQVISFKRIMKKNKGMCPLVSSGLNWGDKIHLELQFSLVSGLRFIKGMAESNNRALERPSLVPPRHSHSLPASLRRQTPHFPPSLSRQEASWWVCESFFLKLEESQRCCVISFVTEPVFLTPLLSSWLDSQNSKALYLTRPVLPEWLLLLLAAVEGWMLDVLTGRWQT